MKPVDASEIFRNLSGEWLLERDIPGMARMAGTACFAPEGNDILNYREAGRLTLGDGSRFEAHRRYVYRLEEGQIAVYFADGGRDRELFHVLDFAARQAAGQPVIANGQHNCSADQYRIRHNFIARDSFEQEIAVQGPRKRYQSFTRFKRHLPLAESTKSA